MSTIDKNAVTQNDIPQYLTTIRPGTVGEYVLLPGDPARCDRTARYLENAELVANNREHRTFTGFYKGLRVSVCSTGMGCPSAAIATEELIHLGCKVFIRIGSTAAIKPGIRIGDLIVSTGAMKNEGTSRMYVPDAFPAVPDLELTHLLLTTARELEGRHPVHYGIGTTDDAFYAETPAFIDRVRSYGCINLDMEASGIFTVAQQRGVRAAAIYGASANLADAEITYADGTPEDGNTRLVDAWEREIQVALETMYRFSQR